MKKRRIQGIIIISTVLLITFISLSVYVSKSRVENAVEETIANHNLKIAKSIASNIDIETYKKFLKDRRHDYNYWKIKNYLNASRESLGVSYVYTLEIDNPQVSNVMIGTGTFPENHIDIGQPCTVPEKYVRDAFYNQQSFVTGEILDEYLGVTYITVGTPILDKNQTVIGYLGIDISTDKINEIKSTVKDSHMAIIIANSIFIIGLIACLLFMQRWFLKEIKEKVEDTEDTYQSEIKTLITSVSSLRHDYKNHIQVIHGLLMIGEPEKARQYVDSISEEIQVINAIQTTAQHPGLAILLQAKEIAAQNHRIEMLINVSSHPFDYIKTTDLIKILSNLIDNAIDASLELPEEQRYISIDCFADDKRYIFKVVNNGPTIVDTKQIFKSGFSTKPKEQGKIRGQGLFIVQEIVHKYNGKISIHSSEDLKITATIEIPIG